MKNEEVNSSPLPHVQSSRTFPFKVHPLCSSRKDVMDNNGQKPNQKIPALPTRPTDRPSGTPGLNRKIGGCTD